MTYTARLEPLVSVIRVYSADALPPAGYVLSVVVQGDEGSAQIKGLVAADLLPGHCAAMLRCLRDAGYHTVWWVRRDSVTGEERSVIRRTGLPVERGIMA